MMNPSAVVQAQLDAYNAKDIDALMLTYAPDARQFTLHGPLLAEGTTRSGRAMWRASPSRTCMHASSAAAWSGNIVSDVEIVTRNFPDGLGTVEMLCVYEVADGRIQAASFATGTRRCSRFNSLP